MGKSEPSPAALRIAHIADSPTRASTEGRIIQSMDGYAVDKDDDTWKLNRNISINVGRVRKRLLPRLREGYTETMAYFASNRRAPTARIYLYAIATYLEKSKAHSFTVAAILNYRAGLNRMDEHMLIRIRSFLKCWDRIHPGELDAKAMSTLNALKLKPPIHGDRVKRLDPQQGPLTDLEMAAFNEGAVIAFEKGAIDLSDLTLCLFSSHGGRRPIQLSHCKVCDLQPMDQNGKIVNLLHVPRAKQRGDGFRTSFTTFAMSVELCAVVTAQAESAIRMAKAIFGASFQQADRGNVPLIPNLFAMRVKANQGVSTQTLRTLLATDVFHIDPENVTKVLQRAVEAADVRSERTGELLHINAYRFRYTVGTRAAREGFGALLIAALLDQSGSQCAKIYTAHVPEFAEKIDAAIGHQLVRYAKAFQGTVVKREADAELGDDQSSRLRFKGIAIATCGQQGKCGANVPIPCYTCSRFQPWADAPHHIILQGLLAERQEVLNETNDRDVAAANDRTILAVMQVIEKCAALKQAKTHQPKI